MPERTRRFPPPWTAEEHDARFIVRDRNYQTLANFTLKMSPVGDFRTPN